MSECKDCGSIGPCRCAEVELVAAREEVVRLTASNDAWRKHGEKMEGLCADNAALRAQVTELAGALESAANEFAAVTTILCDMDMRAAAAAAGRARDAARTALARVTR